MYCMCACEASVHAILLGTERRCSLRSWRQVFLVLGSYISTSLIENISKLDIREKRNLKFLARYFSLPKTRLQLVPESM